MAGMRKVRAPMMPPVVMQARTRRIERLVQQCAAGEITFDDLQREVAAMGYRTTSLHEMVLAAEGEMKRR